MGKMGKDNLGARMKDYEYTTRTSLPRRVPVIIRIDGKAFHTFTRGFQKPFDAILMKAMWETTKFLCQNIQGCRVGYTQSDEISLLLTDYESMDSCAWFDNNILKMVSVSASMATLAFNKAFREGINELYRVSTINALWDEEKEKYLQTLERKVDTAMFDSRVFVLPKEEVINYFIWRQQDASRNSVQMVGRANFSHKQLENKSGSQIQEMLFQEKGINWNNLPAYEKRGACIVKEKFTLDNGLKTERSRWVVDKDIPMFTKDRSYIDKFVYGLFAGYKVVLTGESGSIYCDKYEATTDGFSTKLYIGKCTCYKEDCKCVKELILPTYLIEDVVKL